MTQLRLLIMDTGPLITLAAAESLDYLFMPGLPVLIPDAILFEATLKSDALGAADIMDWTQEHIGEVQIIATRTLATHFAGLERGERPEPGLGERSALEVARNTPYLGEGEQALLLTEDDRLIRGNFVTLGDEDRIMAMTTYDFLDGLEQAQRINSVDEVYQRASDAGRLASKRSLQKEKHEAAMASLQAVLELQAKVRK
jgi:hypothetical protein